MKIHTARLLLVLCWLGLLLAACGGAPQGATAPTAAPQAAAPTAEGPAQRGASTSGGCDTNAMTALAKANNAGDAAGGSCGTIQANGKRPISGYSATKGELLTLIVIPEGSDIAIDLTDTSGKVVATVNEAGKGQPEILSYTVPADSSYSATLREVGGVAGNAQVGWYFRQGPAQASEPTTAPTKAAEPTTAPTQVAEPTTAPTKAAEPTTAPAAASSASASCDGVSTLAQQNNAGKALVVCKTLSIKANGNIFGSSGFSGSGKATTFTVIAIPETSDIEINLVDIDGNALPPIGDQKLTVNNGGPEQAEILTFTIPAGESPSFAAKFRELSGKAGTIYWAVYIQPAAAGAAAPTAAPTTAPTKAAAPTAAPTTAPTKAAAPTVEPTVEPTAAAQPTTASAATETGDIQLDGLEVTQGLQNSLNEMLLFKGRPTFVVTHLHSLTGKPVPNVKLQLVVSNAQGKQLGTLNQLNAPIEVTTPDDDAFKFRAYANEYDAYFRLNDEWLNGDVTVKLTGAPLVCNEASDSTKDCAVKASFTKDMPVLKVKIFLGKQTAGAATEADAQRFAMLLETFYPVKVSYTTEVWDYSKEVATHDQMHAGLDDLLAQYKKDGNPAMHYAALFVHPQGQGGTAFTTAPIFIASLPKDSRNVTVLMHEFGHTFGLGHGYDEPGNPRDKNFPSYLDQTVKPIRNQLSAESTGPKAYYGFVTSEGWYTPYVNGGGTLGYGWRIIPNVGTIRGGGGDVLNGGFWVSEFLYRWVLEKLPTLYTR